MSIYRARRINEQHSSPLSLLLTRHASSHVTPEGERAVNAANITNTVNGTSTRRHCTASAAPSSPAAVITRALIGRALLLGIRISLIGQGALDDAD